MLDRPSCSGQLLHYCSVLDIGEMQIQFAEIFMSLASFRIKTCRVSTCCVLQLFPHLRSVGTSTRCPIIYPSLRLNAQRSA